MLTSAAVRPDRKGLCCLSGHRQFKSEICLSRAGSGCSGSCHSRKDLILYGTGSYASLAFNSQSQPYIAYYDSTIGALKIATQLGPNWELDIVDDQGSKDVGRFTKYCHR